MLDPISDAGGVLRHRIEKCVTVPEFVKNAQVTEADSIPATSFVNQRSRTFPIHTKAATWLAHAYYIAQKDSLSPLDKKAMELSLEKAAADWGIELEVAILNNEYAAATKPEVVKVAADCALIRGDQRFLPIDTSVAVEKSAAEFMANRGSLPYADRREAAGNIIKAAEKFGVTHMLSEALFKSAGYGINTVSAITASVGRMGKAAAEAVAAAVAESAPGVISLESAEKIASIMDPVYRARGEFVEDVVHAFTKQAEDRLVDSLVFLADGTAYTKADMAKAASALKVVPAELGCRMCDETSGELVMSKVAAVLPSVPAADTKVVKLAIDSLGVTAIDGQLDNLITLALAGKPVVRAEKFAAPVEKSLAGMTKSERDEFIKRANMAEVAKKVSDVEGAEPHTPRECRGRFIQKGKDSHESITVNPFSEEDDAGTEEAGK